MMEFDVPVKLCSVCASGIHQEHLAIADLNLKWWNNIYENNQQTLMAMESLDSDRCLP